MKYLLRQSLILTSSIYLTFIDVVLEDILVLNLTHKYQRIGLLDLDDRLTVSGVVFHDGGPSSEALHASEFRLLWNRKHSNESNRPLKIKNRPTKKKLSSNVFDLLPSNQPRPSFEKSADYHLDNGGFRIPLPVQKKKKEVKNPTLLTNTPIRCDASNLAQQSHRPSMPAENWLHHLDEYLSNKSLCSRLCLDAVHYSSPAGYKSMSSPICSTNKKDSQTSPRLSTDSSGFPAFGSQEEFSLKRGSW